MEEHVSLYHWKQKHPVEATPKLAQKAQLVDIDLQTEGQAYMYQDNLRVYPSQ
jgi:hypothetical protein